MTKEIYIPVDVFAPVAEVPATVESEATTHFKQGLASGRPWQQVLLEAIGMWTIPHEYWRGREYRYVIQSEAFDWLLLAERLCAEVDGRLPKLEVEQLLFNGRLTHDLAAKEMRDYLGYNKYRGVLNFWYGVVVEDALHLAVEDEIRKELRGGGRNSIEDLGDEVFKRLYAEEISTMEQDFRKYMTYPPSDEATLTYQKEFLYWLFKYRLKYWDPARVASDARKALKKLESIRGTTSHI
ncbi:hypothetical protein FIM12_04240 [SAR202 cluster bacterium AD-804-J14_MRT_500m]|nr:hypothetical protein [SAR202 cluster bacterium AD-804-J14_MRT_500m]